MASPMMASLELMTWRPTPVKPDIAVGSPTPESDEFTGSESFKTSFLIDPEKDADSQSLKSAVNSESAFEGCMSHRKPANGSPRTITLQHKITTNIMSEAALSAKLTLWSWRPTPVKPDLRAGEPSDSYEAAFVLGPADQGYNATLAPSKQKDCTVTSSLAQLAYSATARILELTITITTP